MNFNVNIQSGNQSMVDMPHAEVIRMLRNIQEQLESYSDMNEVSGTLRDINGNKVGSWKLEAYEED